MADRIFRNPYDFESEMCAVHAVWTLGASGAVAIDDSWGCSVAQAATGEYEITLDDRYNALRGVAAIIERETPADSHVEVVEVLLDDKLITVATVTAGSTANLATGTTIYVTLYLKNSSLNP